MTASDLPGLLTRLLDDDVELILVGGMAAIVHGAGRVTVDVDIVYRRTEENLKRLAASLEALNPALRGAPPGLPFRFDADTLRRGLNFTLTTTMGPLDLLGEIIGGGGYDDLHSEAEEVQAFGRTLLCLALPKLIEVKRAAGRPKDLEAIAELEALLDEPSG